MSTAEDVQTEIAGDRESAPYPAHRAVGQISGMRPLPLRTGPVIALLVRLVLPTRKGRSVRAATGRSNPLRASG
jgi:hypothetical protein